MVYLVCVILASVMKLLSGEGSVGVASGLCGSLFVRIEAWKSEMVVSVFKAFDVIFLLSSATVMPLRDLVKGENSLNNAFELDIASMYTHGQRIIFIGTRQDYQLTCEIINIV